MKTTSNIIHAHILIAGLMFWLFSMPVLAEAQFDEELAKAATSEQLQKLLEQYPTKATEIVPKLENTLVKELRGKPLGERYTIREVLPKPGGVSGSLTISENGPSVYLYFTEYPQDRTTFATGSFATIETNVKDLLSSQTVPAGDGSIHRFAGGQHKTIKVGNHILIDEGEKHHRLTFCLLKDQGYVYLRGKGVLITPDGKEVKLGY